ncbi:hypothetical protein [Vagococcus acidifermentans]|uniref:hypothetical protein n=1 Tax=Vagococcus acidifermentans TaxID=564710 RepID=UPI000F85ECE1|nr:hypothetical protein [Vagococcus acidifermentans]
MNQSSSIVPVVLKDNSPSKAPTTSVKPKLACQLKIGEADLRVYNGINQYILSTIIKELRDGGTH